MKTLQGFVKDLAEEGKSFKRYYRQGFDVIKMI